MAANNVSDCLVLLQQGQIQAVSTDQVGLFGRPHRIRTPRSSVDPARTVTTLLAVVIGVPVLVALTFLVLAITRVSR